MSKKYLLIPRLQVFDANGASCSYVAGFPAMTAWLGVAHALQRKIQQKEGLENVTLPKMTISSHSCELLSRTNAGKRKVTTLILQKYPMKKKNDSNEIVNASMFETARCNLNVSLLMEIEGLNEVNIPTFEKAVRQILPSMRIASGYISNKSLNEASNWKVYTTDNEDSERLLRNRLMPGYIPVDRSDLLEKNTEGDALDGLLKALQGVTDPKGWLVPLTVGYKDLSGAMKVLNQRSYDYEHHFVEPIVTVGEFKTPFRFDSIDDMMWEYEYDNEDGTYMCRN